ncbi:hypothetical protein PH586_16435 [Pseudomonas sp. SA3-5]|uniref:Uncharacterized protein n=1 Tax=Pseudomonas aestuarii TaxID=3018340 RepID=A0ABT4XID8_9PSED|nr:hypothetical protein [Pseudomonas aestuarii]MDA7087981.1 hypothetical protein [Pseudomonas aestuarii]
MAALRGKHVGLLDNAYYYRKNRFDVVAELDQLVDRLASVIHVIGQLLGRLSGTPDIPGTGRNLLHGGSQQFQFLQLFLQVSGGLLGLAGSPRGAFIAGSRRERSP